LATQSIIGLALASLERRIGQLHSREHYLNDGDANTSFFHLQASFRMLKKLIPILISGEQVLTSQEDNIR